MKRTFILSGCLILLLWGGRGWGADADLSLSVSIHQEYNDNVFYDEKNAMDDLIITVTPALDFDRATERLNVSLDSSLKARWYSENEELNSADQSYSGGVDALITDRLTAGGSLQFSRDSSQDRDVETTGILLSSVDRDRWTYQLSGNYVLTEKSRLGLTATFHEESFEDDEEDEFDDFKYRQAGLSYSRSLTEKMTLQTQISFGLYDYPQQEVENYSGTAGVGVQMTEKLSGYIYLGGRYTTFTYHTYSYEFNWSTYQMVAVPIDIDMDKSGFVGNMGVTWQGEKVSLNLSGEHDLQATSGTNGTTRRTGATLSLSYRLAEEISSGLTGSFFSNQSDRTEYSSGADSQTFSLTPRIRYEMCDWATVSAAYRYTRIERRGQKTVDNNTAWIILTMRHELFDQ